LADVIDDEATLLTTIEMIPIPVSVVDDASQEDLRIMALKLNSILGFYDSINLAQGEFWALGNSATSLFIHLN